MGNTTTKSLSALFGRYAFADSMSVTGHFTSFSVVNKDVVKNCNFNFDSVDITIDSIDGMFDGCSNAVFSSRLSIRGDSSIKSASGAFRDCTSAKIPVVDIGDSSILRCDYMFENCTVAELCGAQIPEKAQRFEGMFRNAKSAFFNDISLIPSGNGNYHELFSGCESGVFNNLEFGDRFPPSVDCGFMFYYCGSMDCGKLGLDRVSKYINDAGYMFYAAGSNGSRTLDNNIYKFMNLSVCERAFAKSNFSFENSYFMFYGDGELDEGVVSRTSTTSISGMFSECGYCADKAPVVVLGKPRGEDFELSSIDTQLDKRLYGHYNTGLNGCILDFSSLYEGSDFSTLDIRGISNNGLLVSEMIGCVQNFTSMCNGCRGLRRIIGYLPQCASTYERMFSGCTSLSADLASLFKVQPYGWTDSSGLANAFNRENAFESYSMTSIRGMFEGCANLYSSEDSFDLVGLLKTVERNMVQNGYGSHSDVLESIRGSMPPMRLVTKEPIEYLGNVRYAIEGISENSGVVRYGSYDGNDSGYGLLSDYARSAFSRGFYRYGGEFLGERGMCFFVMFRPEVDDITGNIVGFNSDYVEGSVELMPHGWGETFNTDTSKGQWSEFRYDRLYPAMICRNDGTFVKFAYVGNYTRIYHEKRRTGDSGTYEYVANYSMPVTYFDGLEENISPL